MGTFISSQNAQKTRKSHQNQLLATFKWGARNTKHGTVLSFLFFIPFGLSLHFLSLRACNHTDGIVQYNSFVFVAFWMMAEGFPFFVIRLLRGRMTKNWILF
jgi:hypothetical protein